MGKGIEDICELEYTDHKAAVTEFQGRGGNPIIGSARLDRGILIPQIRFLTNDAWALVSGIADGNGFPLLLMDRYSKGILYVLTIPENFNDLYRYPPEVLSAIKQIILRDSQVRLDAPAQISLFQYDNNTFIVESFLPTETNVTLSVPSEFTKLHDLLSDQMIPGQPERSIQLGGFGNPPPASSRTLFSVQMQPHSYQVFELSK
jgi:hypothetical protein